MEPHEFGIFIPFGAFIMVIFIVWMTSHEKQVKARYRSEVQKELIAKFGTGQELTEFLNSAGSRHLLGSLAIAKDPQREVRNRTVGLITGGLINLSIGAAFLYVGFSWRQGFVLVGLILIGVGVSLLISAAIGYYLSKKWGLDKPGGVLTPGA